MDRLTIHPVSEESALAMLAALSGFHAELLESADGWEIVVTLGLDGRNDGEIIAALNALAEYVNKRAGGPARVEMNGRHYVMHPEVD
jgi:hypothetical protein